MTIDQYIESQRQDVNSTDLRVLGTFSSRLLDKLKETDANEYPGLREAVHLISPGCWNRRQSNRRKIRCQPGWLKLALLQVTS